MVDGCSKRGDGGDPSLWVLQAIVRPRSTGLALWVFSHIAGDNKSQHDRAFQDFLTPPLQFQKRNLLTCFFDLNYIIFKQHNNVQISFFLYKGNFSIKWFSLQILSSAYILYRMVWPGLFYRMPTNIDALYKMLVHRSKKVKW